MYYYGDNIMISLACVHEEVEREVGNTESMFLPNKRK